MKIVDAMKILEIETPFNSVELKACYREALLVWHPDRFEGNIKLQKKAERKTKEINDAYILLSNLCNVEGGEVPSGDEKNGENGAVESSHKRSEAVVNDTQSSSAFSDFIGILLILTIVLSAYLISNTGSSEPERESVQGINKTSHLDLRDLPANGLLIDNTVRETAKGVSLEKPGDQPNSAGKKNANQSLISEAAKISSDKLKVKEDSLINNLVDTAPMEAGGNGASGEAKGHVINCKCSLCKKDTIKGVVAGNGLNKDMPISNSFSDEQIKRLANLFAPSPDPNEFHEWTDTLGRAITAKYLGHKETDAIILKKQDDGSSHVVPLARLSEASRQLAEKIRQALNSMPEKLHDHMPGDIRLPSGKILVDRVRGNSARGALSVDNGLSADALIKIVEAGRLVLSFYVRGGQKYEIANIPDGSYDMLYCTGYGWDPSKKDFTRGKSARKHDSSLRFNTEKTIERRGDNIITRLIGTSWTITLHKVINGNAKTHDINIDEFDSYK